MFSNDTQTIFIPSLLHESMAGLLRRMLNILLPDARPL